MSWREDHLFRGSGELFMRRRTRWIACVALFTASFAATATGTAGLVHAGVPVTAPLSVRVTTVALRGDASRVHRRNARPRSQHEHHEHQEHQEHQGHRENHRHHEERFVFRPPERSSRSRAGLPKRPDLSGVPAKVTRTPRPAPSGAPSARFRLHNTAGAASGMNSISVFSLAAAAVLVVAVAAAAVGRRLTGHRTGGDLDPAQHPGR